MKAESLRKSSAHGDRGWAWVVCIAGHICTVLTIGYATSLGVLFIEWKEHFDLSATASSWVVGMPQLVASPLSLIMGAIALRLGIRRVSMLGSAVSGLATILGSFSTDVWHLYLSGAMSGIGIVMVVSPALVILAHYFRKRYALANGLVILGVSTGMMVFPPFFRVLIENYGWRGAMLIAGAIQMNGMAACALFRPLKACSVKVGSRGRRLKNLDDEGAVDMDIDTAVSGTNNHDQTRKPTENEQPNDSLKKHFHESTISERKWETEGLTDTVTIETVVSDQQFDTKLHLPESVPTRLEKYVSPENVELIGEVSRQGRTAAASNRTCPEENRVRRKLRDLFGFLDVFSNSKVMSIIFASCFFAIGLSTNATHLPARVKEAGWSEDQGASVLSIYAIFTVITRAAHGWFVDRNYIGAFKLQSIVLLGCAIVASLNPVSDSYVFLIGYGVLLGGFTGIAAPLIFVTAKSVACPSQVPATLGLILCTLFLFNGTGPVVAGKMHDATGNYVVPFVVAGVMFLAAFILTVIVAVCKRGRQTE